MTILQYQFLSRQGCRYYHSLHNMTEGLACKICSPYNTHVQTQDIDTNLNTKQGATKLKLYRKGLSAEGNIIKVYLLLFVYKKSQIHTWIWEDLHHHSSLLRVVLREEFVQIHN